MDVRDLVPGLRELQGVTLGDPEVCVAVLDGPVDLAHPCFAGADLTALETLVPNVADDSVMALHGTHVASLLFGQPDGPVPGIAPRCRGLVAPVFRDGERCSQLDLARAIDQALDAGADIINISGGERAPAGEAQDLLARTLRRCADDGVLVVAAVGNDGCDCLQVPASVDTTLAVGACGADGQPLDSSNWGETYRSHGVLAPGRAIEGARPGGGTAALTGSSFATPIVSGVAALLSSARRAAGRAGDPRAVSAAILAGAAPCLPADDPGCRRFLSGTLDVPRASELVLQEGGTAVDSPDAVTTMPEQSPGEQAPPEPTVGVEAAGECSCPPEPPAVRPSEVRPASGCGCGGEGGGAGGGALVYALGAVGYDFRTEAERDGFRQQMKEFEIGRDNGVPIMAQPNPYDPRHLARYLAENPWASDKLTWTLNLDRTPIYALEAENPVGMTWEPFTSPDANKPELEDVVGNPKDLATILSGFGAHPPVSYVYKVFRDAVVGQVLNPADPDTIDSFVSRVSIPGRLTGRTVRLFSGQIVPVVRVSARGLYTWNEARLVQAVVDQVEEMAGQDGANAGFDRTTNERNVRAFLDKIYYQFRNTGQSPQDRALNFAGTNAFLFGSEIQQGFLSGEYVPGPDRGLFALDTISVAKSPYCRMDSDCWDVVITFFDPVDERRARVSWLFTIDVSAELPVSLAPPHRFLGR
ncbi:cyanobactin maturation protease PatG family protein [Pseudonocardia sp. D17]|jgi:hypothetical protein|uniref:cyanobactin maturation protease PatG family protein n=1 Tax=Pseudonocardia sp. D17 TaxID=882661 RepID=UPI002B3F1361|nr:protease [Pseudonocardia sp. D17]